jgi:hypothetical protein
MVAGCGSVLALLALVLAFPELALEFPELALEFSLELASRYGLSSA